MHILKYILLLIFTCFLYIWEIHANINLTVSPIKYEIKWAIWETITKTAILFNKSDEAHTILTWKSDFESKDDTWNPHFIRSQKNVFTWQELSNWIEIDTESFVIEPGEQKDITFTITIPENATPGWHYWAIFFKNNNSDKSSSSQIAINIDYWVLILVEVDWEIITKIEVDDTIIKNESSTLLYWLNENGEIDKCFLFDLTASKYDWKCIDNFFSTDEDIDLTSADEDIQNFNIFFETLFKNLWNTHVKPFWKIILIDENGKEIKRIWKEIIKNDAWAIIWEKIVDYLPINDNWWNILPKTKRNFKVEWRWFPYEFYDEYWKKVIRFWSPEEYYTKQNIEKRWLLPWERINQRINHKTIKAEIDISYIDNNWELIDLPSAQEFYIDYKDEYIWLNPYVIISAWIFALLILFFWIIVILRRKKCPNCGKKVERDMKVCPYCGEKLKKKKKSKKKKKD